MQATAIVNTLSAANAENKALVVEEGGLTPLIKRCSITIRPGGNPGANGWLL